MSIVYLIRHGQAGTRESYDSLSDLGRQQARLLGQYFLSQNLKFQTVLSGSLQRQRQTAEEAARAYKDFPEIQIDPQWDEFDLTRVYREIAPQLCAESPEFSAECQSMKEQIRASEGAASAAVHRQWLPCDVKIVQAWVSGRYQESGETWQQFHDRIAGNLDNLRALPDDHHIAIFTSATPIGIFGGLGLDIADDRCLRLAGVIHNASYSVFRLRGPNLRLFSFNGIPHLQTPELRTHR